MKKYIALLLLSIGILSCSTVNNNHMVGNDVDKHGCRASAGYTWSEVRHDCVRIWEVGTPLRDVLHNNSTSRTYVVFSQNKSQAEVFIPSGRKNLVMKRHGNMWKKGNYTLSYDRNRLALYNKGLLIFKQ